MQGLKVKKEQTEDHLHRNGHPSTLSEDKSIINLRRLERLQTSGSNKINKRDWLDIEGYLKKSNYG